MKKFLLTFFSLGIVSLSFFAGKTFATDAVPKAPVDCSQTANPEFNSDRPYQASPCGDAPKALFCGNNLVVTEGYSKTLTSNFVAPGETITVNILVNKTYTISLKDMQLPILGNTEKIKNSTNPTSQIDEATRMNEYVSAYLNGTNSQAEYGQTDLSKIVDFSGPLKKLLPGAIQDAQRIDSIKNVAATENHNQIVVCGESSLGIIGDITGLGTFKPTECYPNGDNTKAQGRVFRLVKDNGGFVGAAPSSSNSDPCSYVCSGVLGPASINCKRCQGQGLTPLVGGSDSWEGDLSFWNTWIDDIVGRVVNILPSLPRETIKKSVLNHWNKRIPPLPWENDPFSTPPRPMTSIEYQKYYNEWRGKTCVIIPIINLLVCFDNILVPNTYADLYPYIPLATTTDKAAKVPVPSGKAEIKESGGTVLGPAKDSVILSEPNIYFAHTQENADLSNALNKTYIPKVGTDDKISPETTQDNSTQCSVVNVRSNDGDNLFPEVEPNSYIFTAKFTIKEIPCGQVEEKERCVGPKNHEICSIRKSQKCDGEVTITLKTITKTPYADEIWKTTTAGNSSTFRKIYPKVEPGAPVTCISDIPASTNATYKLESAAGSGGTTTGDLSVVGPDGEKSDGSSAHLYFPHLGSVYDYFLKGIQTALRPKGYGEPVESGTLCTSSTTGTKTGGDICAIASKYNIPCCQLKGVEALETGGGTNTGSGSCGNFKCCKGAACGPAQILCGQIGSFSGKDKIDVCSTTGSAELLARAMLLKLCQADKKCDSYDWSKWGDFVTKNYKVGNGNYTAAAYFYGLRNGCTVNACTEYRWGAGKTYCDSVKSYCETGQVLPDNTSPQFCSACNADLERAGQKPINCSGP